VEVQALNHPYAIDAVHDGGIYQARTSPLVQTNLFLKVGRVDDVYIKVPSKRGLDDYRKFVKLAQTTSQDIRSLEDAERFERLGIALEVFAGLKPIAEVSAEFAHYLVVHKLQYERLLGQTAVEIPRSKFALLRFVRLGIFKTYVPALFQEPIRGTTLWDMFDFVKLTIKPRWRPFLPAISAQLAEFLESGLRNHVDWNIKNFIFDEIEERLFYVDLKPTTFVARSSNAQNLQGIRDFFIV
jgi:hypothetical protein